MKKRVVLLGDSITQGLGSKKINFTEELQHILGENYFVENRALTGTTVHYAEKILPEIIKIKPEFVIIVYGNVDAQIRPNRNGYIFKHIPKRFQKNGMLMPRPFYSHRRNKRVGQKIENVMRHLCSSLIYAIDGSEQWVNIEEFSNIYSRIVQDLWSAGIKVIACSTVFIDEKVFPGSLAQYEAFNAQIKKTVLYEKGEYIDLFFLLKTAVEKEGWNKIYCYDHFHPNEGGYKIIASKIAEKVVGE